MVSPKSGCLFSCSHSSSVGLPGLLRIAVLTSSFPMSWSSAAQLR